MIPAVGSAGASAEADRPRFDLVFVDPPYEADLYEPVLTQLAGGLVLDSESVVVVEHPKRHPLPPVPGLRVGEERRYGDTMVTRLARSEPIRR